MTNQDLNAKCIVDSANGVYIPQIFAKRYKHELKRQFETSTDAFILDDLSNPENKHYWDTWDLILNNFEMDGKVLIHDEDLWLVDKEDAELWEYI